MSEVKIHVMVDGEERWVTPIELHHLERSNWNGTLTYEPPPEPAVLEWLSNPDPPSQ